jgi:hypothetical protein
VGAPDLSDPDLYNDVATVVTNGLPEGLLAVIAQS